MTDKTRKARVFARKILAVALQFPVIAAISLFFKEGNNQGVDIQYFILRWNAKSQKKRKNSLLWRPKQGIRPASCRAQPAPAAYGDSP
jgi:hypothetical protein